MDDEQPEQFEIEEMDDENVIEMAERAFFNGMHWLGIRNNLHLEEEIVADEDPDIPDSERVNFDMEATTSHRYLEAEEEVDRNMRDYWIEGTEHLELPVIRQNLVCLPGQVVPIHTIFPADRQAVRMAVDNKTYLALQTCFETFAHGWYNEDTDTEMTGAHGNIGTLLAPRQISDDGYQIKAVMIGKQRCRFLSFERTITGALLGKVEVVPGTTMLPLINTVCPNSQMKHNIRTKRRLAQAVGVSLIAADIVSLEHNCKILSDWMLLWYSKSQIEATLQQGVEKFSFWVAMNIPSHIKAKYEYLEQDCVDLRIMTLVKMIKSLTEIVCKSCNIKISKMDKIIKMSVESTSEVFVNNYGVTHEMLTVSESENILHTDIPRAEYSWFPGYKWQIINCVCGKHLGWEFTSKRLNPPKFYGLTRNGIMPRNEKSEDDSLQERDSEADYILRLIQSTPRLEEALL